LELRLVFTPVGGFSQIGSAPGLKDSQVKSGASEVKWVEVGTHSVCNMGDQKTVNQFNKTFPLSFLRF